MKLPDSITIMQVPDLCMPYDTVADWRIIKGRLVVSYVSLGDRIFEYLLAHHEIDEAMLCCMQGITAQQVDKFDETFERMREPNDISSEPGEQFAAPYHFAHSTAEANERVLALALGVKWGQYNDAVELAFKRVRDVRRQAKAKDSL